MKNKLNITAFVTLLLLSACSSPEQIINDMSKDYESSRIKTQEKTAQIVETITSEISDIELFKKQSEQEITAKYQDDTILGQQVKVRKDGLPKKKINRVTINSARAISFRDAQELFLQKAAEKCELGKFSYKFDSLPANGINNDFVITTNVKLLSGIVICEE